MPKKYPFNRRDIIYCLMFHPLTPDIRKAVYDEATFDYLWERGYRLISSKLLARLLRRVITKKESKALSHTTIYAKKIAEHIPSHLSFVEFTATDFKALLAGARLQIQDAWITAIADTFGVPEYKLYTDRRQPDGWAIYMVKWRDPTVLTTENTWFVMSPSEEAASLYTFNQLFFNPDTDRERLIHNNVELIVECKRLIVWDRPMEVGEIIDAFTEARELVELDIDPLEYADE